MLPTTVTARACRESPDKIGLGKYLEEIAGTDGARFNHVLPGFRRKSRAHEDVYYVMDLRLGLMCWEPRPGGECPDEIGMTTVVVVFTVEKPLGIAWAFTRFSSEYVAPEAEARDRRVGVWQGVAEAPWDYRAARWAAAAQVAPNPECLIKGNVSWAGDRIYHTPWSPWYDRTSVNASNGERWFCDEAEAREAGWRTARYR